MKIQLQRYLKFTACLSASLALTGALVSSLAAQDKVFPIQGAVASGKLIEITRDEITIEVRGNNQKLPVAEVRKVVFDDEPNGLDRAREMFTQSLYTQVLDELKKIDVSAIKNPLIVQDVEFYRFASEGKLGLTGSGGDKAKAKAGLLALAGKNKNSHHMLELSELLGDLAVGLGKPDEAVRYYGLLANSPNGDTKALAAYRLAQLDLSQGKNTEARTRFQQLLSSTSTSAKTVRLKSLAEVGVALCDAREGKPQQALDQLKQMVVKYESTDQELFARIYNAQGACYIALEKPSLALLAYLRTDMLFFTDAEAHAEALYQLVQLWPKAGEPSRATETRTRLVSQYAGSIWASK